MVGVDLLAEARAAGLSLASEGDRLVLRGRRSQEPLALMLLEHKKEILELLRQDENGSQVDPTPDLPALPRGEHDLRAKAQESIVSLEVLRNKRDRLVARLDKGCHFLDRLAERVGQESAEYDRYFAIWLQILREFEQTDDEITRLQARQEFAEWHARRTTARAQPRRIEREKTERGEPPGERRLLIGLNCGGKAAKGYLI